MGDREGSGAAGRWNRKMARGASLNEIKFKVYLKNLLISKWH